MVGLLHAMAFMVLLLVGWVIWNNKPSPLPLPKTTCRQLLQLVTVIHSGVERLYDARGRLQKCRPFHPSNLLTKLKMKEDHVSWLFGAIRLNKASWKSQSNTHKLKYVIYFIVDYESCFCCFSPPFLSLIFLFFAFFT